MPNPGEHPTCPIVIEDDGSEEEVVVGSSTSTARPTRNPANSSMAMQNYRHHLHVQHSLGRRLDERMPWCQQGVLVGTWKHSPMEPGRRHVVIASVTDRGTLRRRLMDCDRQGRGIERGLRGGITWVRDEAVDWEEGYEDMTPEELAELVEAVMTETRMVHEFAEATAVRR